MRLINRASIGRSTDVSFDDGPITPCVGGKYDNSRRAIAEKALDEITWGRSLMNLRAGEFAGDGWTGTSIESEREETVAALCSFRCRGMKCVCHQRGGLIQLYSRCDSRNVYYVRIHFLVLHTQLIATWAAVRKTLDSSFTEIFLPFLFQRKR